MNVEFSKLCLKDVFYIVCTYCTTKELINSFAPYIYFVNPITTRTASRNTFFSSALDTGIDRGKLKVDLIRWLSHILWVMASTVPPHDTAASAHPPL